MKKLLWGYVTAVATLAALAGCEQDKVIYSGPDYLMFSDTLYMYGVQESNEVFNIPVSATVRAGYDRTFAVEVIDTKSNAVEGKHYKLLSNTVTIKAGEMAANVEVQGNYESIEPADSLGFVLRLVVPEANEWELYGIEAKVLLQKVCPFDINNFTGYCKVISSYFEDYLLNTDLRLITSDIAEGEENTIVLHGIYYDGYDTKITFNREDVLEPLIEMEEQPCGTTGEAFGTIYGDGKLLMEQPTSYTSYYNTCENYILQFVTLSVDNKDGSEYGVVGTYINAIEWISDAEAEKLKEQGY